MAGVAKRSDMDRVSKGLEGALMDRLAERRVCMDDAGDVLEHRAHLHECGKLSGQLGDVRADSLQAQDAAVGLARDNPDESGWRLRGHRKRPAAGLEREPADDAIDAGGRVVGADADRHDLRLGEAHRWTGDGIEPPPRPGDDLGNHLALSGRLVRQHWLAHQVSDRPDAGSRGGAAVVDFDEPPHHRERAEQR